MTRLAAIAGLDAGRYPRHSLHAEQRIWVEKNCYVDVWIEVLHALRLEPLAMLPFASAIDFLGGQWTFFKPHHDELRDLYGLDVQELNVWRPLLEHAGELLEEGCLVATEADAYWLPDVAATDYRRHHSKSTIVLAELDVAGQRLGYFHNAGFFVLEAEDFRGLFQLDGAGRELPLFAEVIRLDRMIRRPTGDLVEASLNLWRAHRARWPQVNPIDRFRARFERDLGTLQERGLSYYHAWAFGTTRQLGAASELCAENLRWLDIHGGGEFSAAIAAFEALAAACKTFILKAARSVNGKRAFATADTFAEMARLWDEAHEQTAAGLTGRRPARPEIENQITNPACA